MSFPPTSCQDFIRCIQRGGSAKEKCVEILYEKHFQKTINLLAKKWSALSHQTVKDCYTDAFMVLIKLIQVDKFVAKDDNACAAFLYYVTNKRCSDARNKDMRKPEIIKEPEDRDMYPDPPSYEYDSELLANCMNKLNKTCQKVLLDWSEGYNMQEIATRNELKNANVAAVTRKRCMIKLIGFLKDEGMEGLK